MPTSFKTILVPVDFSDNTDLAVNKAVALADPDNCTIHLLHVTHLPASRSIPFIFIDQDDVERIASDAEAVKKLKQWKMVLEEIGLHIQVQLHLVYTASVEEAIIRMAKETQADLVLIGKSNAHPLFPFLNTISPNRISRRADCAVFVAKRGALHRIIKTLVVPVTDKLPERKMELVQALCKSLRIRIHLVTFVKSAQEPEPFSASSLLQVYKWLKTSLRCPVEYAVLHGNSKTKALLAYAETVGADVLLVHPVTETKMGWRNTHLSDVLPPASRVQVLIVQPANS